MNVALSRAKHHLIIVGSLRFLTEAVRGVDPDAENEDLSFLSPPYDVVMCCEVLEHVNDPPAALASLDSLGAKRLILSVPHEPFFMLSNLARGKNVTRFGNDPEHLHHWTKASFKRLLGSRFDVLALDTSYPWIVALCESRQARS